METVPSARRPSRASTAGLPMTEDGRVAMEDLGRSEDWSCTRNDAMDAAMWTTHVGRGEMGGMGVMMARDGGRRAGIDGAMGIGMAGDALTATQWHSRGIRMLRQLRPRFSPSSAPTSPTPPSGPRPSPQPPTAPPKSSSRSPRA